ncbi:conserved hypothetical protein [Paraburkholderia piptadeniae]|uniref:Uncharacterized protein n=2 Tax=Paraburkholderia TaxID=1822464 RepID=A0A7X1TLL9_9BURK|nr:MULTISPECIES: hypothetical protein [Paraburkholderia]MPW23653.1 hypothetical protein [Paraburkholderia franconis]SIT52164.1 conserved hypothetical protein [Paraburkholderia piptadeniae]
MTADNDRIHLEQVAEQAMEQMFATSPETAAFHRGNWIDSEYYRRHLVETVLQNRLNNEVDAFALYKLGYKDNMLAQILAQYLAGKYGRHGLFFRDIERFGLSADHVDCVRPFHSTDRLIHSLYLSIGREGPLSTIVWDWFVEWYSDRYNKLITEAADRALGRVLTNGSPDHIAYDNAHGHADLMQIALELAIDRWGGVEKAEYYLCHFVKLYGEYLNELRAATVPQFQTAAGHMPVDGGRHRD